MSHSVKLGKVFLFFQLFGTQWGNDFPQTSQVQQHTQPAFRKQRQEVHSKFKASLVYVLCSGVHGETVSKESKQTERDLSGPSFHFLPLFLTKWWSYTV